MRIRPPFRSKSNSYTESCRVDAATTNGEKSAEAIVAGQSVKGRINRSLEYDRERRNGLEHRKQERKLPAKG